MRLVRVLPVTVAAVDLVRWGSHLGGSEPESKAI